MRALRSALRRLRARASAAASAPVVIRWLHRGVGVAPLPAVGATAVLAAPGRGNIGDEALIEAFIDAVGGDVIVIVRDPADVTIPPEPRVRVVALPALVYGGPRGHARDLRRFADLLAGVRSVAVIGADIMDGHYNPAASVKRAAVAEFAARHGRDARVIGFSWNSTPHRSALAALRRAQSAGVRLFVRDPASVERARRDGLEVTPAADIVFTAQSVDATVADRLDALVNGQPVALVNASGLVQSSADLVEEYASMVTSLRADGYAVVLLPHVFRAGTDDLAACRAVAERVGDPIVLVEDMLTPAQVRALAARAGRVITGRMHLAVMTLLAGGAPVTLATQGKVEGLFRLVACPELCVAPSAGLADTVAALFAAPNADAERRGRVRAALPEVAELAWRNVDGLPPRAT